MSGSKPDLEFNFGVGGFQPIDAAFSKLESRLNTAASLQRRYAEETVLAQRAFDQGRISAERYSQTVTALEASHQRDIQALERSTTGYGRFSQVMGQAGFQAQDFAVQVQGGTSALTAMAQQLPQFLGVFGTGGAIAGAAVAAGALAIKFLDIGGNADVAREKGQAALDAMARSGQETARVLSSINELFLSAGQRAANLANIQRGQLRTQAQSRLDDIAAGRQELARRLAEEETYLRDLSSTPVGQVWGGQGRSIDIYRAESNRDQALEAQAIVRVRELRGQLTAADREAEQLRESLRRLDNAGRVGAEEYGPTTRDPGGVNAMRAQMDQKFAIQQRYEERIREINAKVANEEATAAEATTLTNLALQERNRALEDLAKRSANATRATRTLVDVFAINPDGSRGEAFQREAGVQRLLDRWRGEADRETQKAADKERREQEKREKEQERELERRLRREERVTDDIVQYSADRFADMFSETEGGWNRMWQNMRRTAASLAARIAAEAVIRPIVQPVVSSLMGSTALAGAAGSTSGSSSLFGGLSQALGLANLGETLGLGSISQSLGLSSLGSSLGLSGAGGLLGTTLWTAPPTLGTATVAAADPIALGYATAAETGAGVSLGSLLGGAGAGFAAGSLLNSLVGGKSTGGMVGSGLGGLAGAALGSIIPGIGTLIGGLIGGSGGGLLGGLFGPNAPNPAASVQYGLDASGGLSVTGSRTKWMEDAEAIASVEATLTKLNLSIQSLGLTLSGVEGQVHFGKDQRTEEDERNMTLAVLEGLRGGSEAMKQVIQQEIAKARDGDADLDRALAAVDWTKNVYDPIVNTSEATSSLKQTIDALAKSYDEVIKKSEEYGLATDVVRRRLAEAAEAARTEFRGQFFQLSRTAEGRGYLNDVEGVRTFYKENLANFRTAFGGDKEAEDLYQKQLRAVLGNLTGEQLTDVVNSFRGVDDAASNVAAELLRLGKAADAVSDAQEKDAARQSATSALTNLADYSRSISLGGGSPLSAQSQYDLASREFNAVASAALAGDANSIANFSRYAESFRTASQAINGSGSGYAQDFMRIQNIIGQIGGLGAETLTQSFYATTQQSQTDALVAAIARLEQEMAGLRREQQQANARGRAANG